MMNSLLPRLALCPVLLALPAAAQARAEPGVGGIVAVAAGFLTHPPVAAILLALGFLGLLVELKTPSFGLAGSAGLASLALFFGSHMMLGLAGWEVLVLFAAGLVLLAVEAFVLPGFGVAGVLGVLAVVASLVLGMAGPLPTPVDLVQAGAVVLTAVVLLGIGVWQLLERLPRSGKAQLHASTRREDGYVASTPRLDLVGVDGVALTDLHPSGAARFGDERLDVVSEGSFIPAGTPVRVVRADGYRHVVRAL